MANIDKEYNKIIIIQTAFLGDVILITPLIKAVRQLFPTAQIDALVLPQTSSILQNNPHLTEILHFDKRQNKWKSFFRLIRKIRKNRYDLAISPHSSTTTAYLMLLSGIKERLGFDRWHASNYITHKVPHLHGVHKIKKNLHLLTIFTDQEFDIQTEIFPMQQKLEKYEKEILGFSRNSKPVIGIAPGSVWYTKRWPEKNYVELVTLLHQAGYNLIFIGGPDERETCTRIIESAGVDAAIYAGETSPIDSAALLTYCDLLICNDSGAMHIGNAIGTDVIAFFGPTVKDIGYFPFRENDTVMELDMKCRPCGSHGGNKCPLDHHNCMKNISPQSVLDVIINKFKDK